MSSVNETQIIYMIMAAAAVIGVIIMLLQKHLREQKFAKENKWVSTEEFEQQANNLQRRCSEAEFLAFRDFLRSYQGGYVRRQHGKIVQQEYLGKEKGKLKGIFFNVVVPNPNLHTAQKEEFRQFLLSVGVTGISQRPDYAVRDSKLRNHETDEQEHRIKEVGNKGEEIIRGLLLQLKLYNYTVINGAVLRLGDTIKEFDHIVIGNGGMYLIETKAFGMTDGKPSPALLRIGADGSWTLNRNGKSRPLTAPTEQITEQKALLSQIIRSCPVEIHAIAALSNTALEIQQNCALPYAVVRADALTQTILAGTDRLSEMDIRMIALDIDEARVN